MITAVETLAAIVLIILVVLFISHLINGTASDWLKSKFQVAE